jgi:hypothetical protein
LTFFIPSVLSTSRRVKKQPRKKPVNPAKKKSYYYRDGLISAADLPCRKTPDYCELLDKFNVLFLSEQPTNNHF